MPNTLITASRISPLAVALLRRSIVLPGTVSRQAFTDFTGGGGDTVNVRIRSKIAARTQATPGAAITRDAVAETSVPVALSEIYSAVPVADSEWNLDLESFGLQVVAPQAAGIAEAAEDQLAGVMNGLLADSSFALAGSEADTKDQLIAASEALDVLDVPSDGRFLAVSPAIKSRLLAVADFVKVNESGSPEALRRANFGQIYGFTVVSSNALTAGTALAYHSSGFAFASGAPVVPSAVDGSSIAIDGIGMSWLRQYNPDTLSEESVGRVFAGAAAVDAGNRVYKLDTATI